MDFVEGLGEVTEEEQYLANAEDAHDHEGLQSEGDGALDDELQVDRQEEEQVADLGDQPMSLDVGLQVLI